MLRYTRALNGVTLLPRWKRNLALAHLPRTSMELSHRGGGLSWARMYQRKTCGSSVKHAGLKKTRLGKKRHLWCPLAGSYVWSTACLRLGVDANEARSNRVRISVSRAADRDKGWAVLY